MCLCNLKTLKMRYFRPQWGCRATRKRNMNLFACLFQKRKASSVWWNKWFENCMLVTVYCRFAVSHRRFKWHYKLWYFFSLKDLVHTFKTKVANSVFIFAPCINSIKQFLLFQLMHTIIKSYQPVVQACTTGWYAAITLTASIPTSTDKLYL
jgi:hypothetical protein